MNFGKKPLLITVIVIMLAGAIGGYVYFGQSKKISFNFVPVAKKDLVEEVKVTGRVKSVEAVDLAFERGGKVTSTSVEINDKVMPGQVLASLENADLIAQLQQAQAMVKFQQARLDALHKGTRPEELQAAEVKVTNAQISLQNAQTYLTDVQNKATSDLQSTYNNALTAVQKSASVGKSALLALTDIQYAHFNLDDQDSIRLANAKAIAVQTLLGAQNAGRWTNDFLSTANGGAFGIVQNALNAFTPDNIDQALSSTFNALQKVKQALDTIPAASLTALERASLDLQEINVGTEIATISAKQQLIAGQETTNATAIAAAQASATQATSILADAQESLRIKKAGAIPEDIVAQEAQVEQAQAAVNGYQAQIAKTILRSPLQGIVSRKDLNIGEIVPPNISVISVISTGKFELEVNISEADIAKVKLGDRAQVTLDAYGNNAEFNAQVITINPAETVVNGVGTYKATLQFITEDQRIKEGMTANINILTAHKEQVLAVPERTIMTRNNDRLVLVDVGKSQPEERKIEIGIQGSNGYTEIVSGVKEGDQVVSFGQGNN